MRIVKNHSAVDSIEAKPLCSKCVLMQLQKKRTRYKREECLILRLQCVLKLK